MALTPAEIAHIENMAKQVLGMCLTCRDCNDLTAANTRLLSVNLELQRQVVDLQNNVREQQKEINDLRERLSPQPPAPEEVSVQHRSMSMDNPAPDNTEDGLVPCAEHRTKANFAIFLHKRGTHQYRVRSDCGCSTSLFTTRDEARRLWNNENF